MSSSQDPNGRQQRRDLLETIDAQQQTIAKYKTRLRDVVGAYKGLAKEKEALEASLKALSGEADAPEEGSDASTRQGGDDDGGALASKVRTLTASLATVTAEKSRLEASFQEDRRRIHAERKEQDRALDGVTKELAALRTKSKAEVEELKSKLIILRHEREKETSDHAVMLRELQKLIADERRSKEKLEGLLLEEQQKVKTKAEDGAKKEEGEKRMRDLEMKLRLVTEEAEKAKRELRKTTPELAKIKQELAESKLSHDRELAKAERRAEEAEGRASSARVEQEHRVNSLESRLQELSETIGTYDRLRQHDQNEIKRLQGKLHSTDQPATPLLHPQVKDEIYEQESVQALLERFFRLKKLLRERNEKSTNPIDLEALVNDHDGSVAKWKKEHELLKQEFEAFKKRSAAASASGRYLLPEVDQEVILSLKTQISELQDRATSLRMQLLSSEKEKVDLAEREKELLGSLQETKQKAKSRSDAMDNEYRAKVMQLETELQKQRERCLTLIEEKEDEVRVLKANMEMAFEKAFASPDRDSQLRLLAATSMASSGRKSEHQELTDGLRSSNEGMVLHYAQELSHKDVEISSLRQKVFDLESAMRELLLNAVAKEEKLSEELEALKEEVARLRRMSPSREGANMEYLKNVVLSYMLSSDAGSRDHMLKAIGTVLTFSRGDVKRVRDYNAAWWWSHGGGQQGSR